jgi:hypothetical protein
VKWLLRVLVIPDKSFGYIMKTQAEVGVRIHEGNLFF